MGGGIKGATHFQSASFHDWSRNCARSTHVATGDKLPIEELQFFFKVKMLQKTCV